RPREVEQELARASAHGRLVGRAQAVLPHVDAGVRDLTDVAGERRSGRLVEHEPAGRDDPIEHSHRVTSFPSYETDGWRRPEGSLKPPETASFASPRRSGLRWP